MAASGAEWIPERGVSKTMATGTVVLKGGVMATLMAVDQKGGGTDLVTLVLKGGVMATLMAGHQ